MQPQLLDPLLVVVLLLNFFVLGASRLRAVIYGVALQGVILGCTEICLLVQPEDVSVPVFDTTYLHAVAAAEYAMNGAC